MESKPPVSRWLLAALLVGAPLCFVVFDLGQYLSVDTVRAQLERWAGLRDAHPLGTSAAYFALYVGVTALSIPGAAAITLAGGALFGFWWGLVLVSFASTLGATLAFLLSRYVLRDWVHARFQRYLAPVDRGMERDGAFYLFGLRLVPVFPFFVINLVMGLTRLNTWTFVWVSQVGMLVGTAVYVNAGQALRGVEEFSLAGVLSTELVVAMALLGVFPLAARLLFNAFDRRRVLRRFSKPASFDANLIVVGGGAAGLVASVIGSTLRAKTILIEAERMGGDCLYTGCVPSKALIRAARSAAEYRRGEAWGVSRAGNTQVDFSAVMDHVRGAIGRIEPHDSVERYESMGVRCIRGTAKLRSPWEVEVNGQVLSARAIVLATGARPFVPAIPGLSEVPHVTSDTLWNWQQFPERLLVLGAGAVGCELAQACARLGVQVTLVDRASRVLHQSEPEASAQLERALVADGVDLRLGREVSRFESGGPSPGRALLCALDGEAEKGARTDAAIEFDQVLIALGRQPATASLGLEALGVETCDRGFVRVDHHLATTVPTVYACGDLVGPHQLTHMAGDQAWYAAVNGLFGFFWRLKREGRLVPKVVFTDPEVASVGLSIGEANRQGVAYEATRYELAELDRAIADGAASGFVQVLTPPGKDRILGVTIVAEHAGEMLTEWVWAMKSDAGLTRMLAVVHPYPTWSEANKLVASQWRKSHAPERVLQGLAWLHQRRLR